MKAMLAFLVAAIVGLVGFQLYSGKIPEFAPQPAAQAPLPLASPTTPSPFKCDGRTHCSQMKSCEEATYFIEHCPNTEMDGNQDGVPCEKQWCN